MFWKISEWSKNSRHGGCFPWLNARHQIQLEKIQDMSRFIFLMVPSQRHEKIGKFHGRDITYMGGTWNNSELFTDWENVQEETYKGHNDSELSCSSCHDLIIVPKPCKLGIILIFQRRQDSSLWGQPQFPQSVEGVNSFNALGNSVRNTGSAVEVFDE